MQNLPGSRMADTVGLFVFGDNHLVLRGPRPDRAQAVALANYWSVVRIGGSMPESLTRWTIVTKWLRERLDWAAIAPGDGARNPAITQLLGEITDRGIPIDDYSR